MRSGGPFRGVIINPGLMALRTYVLASGGASQWTGTLQYSLELRSATATPLRTDRSRPIPVSSVAGAWRPIDGLFLIPEMVGTTPVDRVNFVIILAGFEDDPDLFLDDVYMHQAP